MTIEQKFTSAVSPQANDTRLLTAYFSGNKGRLEFDNGDFQLTNGEKIWNYNKLDNEVNIYPFDEDEVSMKPSAMLKSYIAKYKCRIAGNFIIDGKTYRLVELNPDLSPEERATSLVTKIKVFIDPETNLIKRWRIYERNGNKYAYTINAFDANKTIPASIFIFDRSKYPGLEENDLTGE
jgi:outer membrane lipoprotein-sorting protein